MRVAVMLLVVIPLPGILPDAIMTIIEVFSQKNTSFRSL